MSYAIDPGESMTAAIPRIVLERIDLARAQLVEESATPEDRVHDARKRFKEIRAALRLVRAPLGDHFAHENEWFRDLGRTLAPVRDADAIIEALEAIAENAGSFHERRVVRSVRRRLRRARAGMRKGAATALIGGVVAQLEIAAPRVTLWPAIPAGFLSVAPGLRRTYKDGRRAFREAHADPSPHQLHEWRKRVKDHWYHIQLFRHGAASFTKPYREQLEQLSSALGDRHDLDVLGDRAIASLEKRDGKVFTAVLQRCSADLTATALMLGDAIYSASARVRVGEIEAAWAESESATSAAAQPC